VPECGQSDDYRLKAGGGESWPKAGGGFFLPLSLSSKWLFSLPGTLPKGVQSLSAPYWAALNRIPENAVHLSADLDLATEQLSTCTIVT
jgi:hypothetical protein